MYPFAGGLGFPASQDDLEDNNHTGDGGYGTVTGHTHRRAVRDMGDGNFTLIEDIRTPRGPVAAHGEEEMLGRGGQQAGGDPFGREFDAMARQMGGLAIFNEPPRWRRVNNGGLGGNYGRQQLHGREFYEGNGFNATDADLRREIRELPRPRNAATNFRQLPEENRRQARLDQRDRDGAVYPPNPRPERNPRADRLRPIPNPAANLRVREAPGVRGPIPAAQDQPSNPRPVGDAAPRPMPPPGPRHNPPLRTREQLRGAAYNAAMNRLNTTNNEQVEAAEDVEPTPAVQRAQQQQGTRECAVCLDWKPNNQFLPVTETCYHKIETCRECVQQWLDSTLTGLNWNRLSCLHAECRELLQHLDVRRIASNDTFERYDNYATRSALGVIPNFKWCINAGCSSGQEHLEGNGNIFHCHACGKDSCTRHNVAWHSGESCEEYENRANPDQRRQVEEQASENLIEATTKPCPNCNTPFEKDEGCQHMRCEECLHGFCWICLADWQMEGMGVNHKPGCRLRFGGLF